LKNSGRSRAPALQNILSLVILRNKVTNNLTNQFICSQVSVKTQKVGCEFLRNPLKINIKAYL